MIINRIRFNNFQAYYKEVIFDFPVDGNKNVSIIYANNDVGKSCFFRGILFCLYGTIETNNLLDIINENAKKENDYNASVTIFATQDNEEIEISRTIRPRGEIQTLNNSKNLQSTLTIIINGKEITKDNEEKINYINSLVHEDASKYFFFDGEKITDYSVANSEKYKEGITRILGIKEIENTIDDFKVISKKLEKERDSVLSEQQEYNSILMKKKIYEDEIEKLQDDFNMIEKNISDINQLIQNHENELKEFVDIAEKVNKKQKLAREIDELKLVLKDYEEKRSTCFKTNSSIILGDILYDRIMRNNGTSINEQYNMTESVKSFLDRLMSGEKCICGEPLNQEHVNSIKEYINNNFITDIEALINRERTLLFSKLSNYKTHAIESKNLYLNLNEKIYEVDIQIQSKELELTKLKKAIGSFNEEAGEKISQDITRQEELKEKQKEKLSEVKVRLTDKINCIEEIESELAKYSKTNDKSRQIQNKLQYTQDLRKVFQTYLGKLLNEKRTEVEEKVTEVFLQLTNNKRKYKGIHITDEYTLQLTLTDGENYKIEPGNPRNPSTGQLKVISLAYIAGLNKSSNYAAPIVIDNPLGLFSEEHRIGLMQYLPSFGKQVIFMVSSGDLSEEYKGYIEPYIKSEYHLMNSGDQTWPKTQIVSKKEY